MALDPVLEQQNVRNFEKANDLQLKGNKLSEDSLNSEQELNKSMKQLVQEYRQQQQIQKGFSAIMGQMNEQMIPALSPLEKLGMSIENSVKDIGAAIKNPKGLALSALTKIPGIGGFFDKAKAKDDFVQKEVALGKDKKEAADSFKGINDAKKVYLKRTMEMEREAKRTGLSMEQLEQAKPGSDMGRAQKGRNLAMRKVKRGSFQDTLAAGGSIISEVPLSQQSNQNTEVPLSQQSNQNTEVPLSQQSNQNTEEKAEDEKQSDDLEKGQAAIAIESTETNEILVAMKEQDKKYYEAMKDADAEKAGDEGGWFSSIIDTLTKVGSGIMTAIGAAKIGGMVKSGIGGAVKGVMTKGFGLSALGTAAGAGIEYGGEKLKEAGYEKTGKAVSTVGTAAKYAGVGGMIGSVVPGVGTAIGAAAGGVIGAGVGIYKNFFGNDEKEMETTESTSKTSATFKEAAFADADPENYEKFKARREELVQEKLNARAEQKGVTPEELDLRYEQDAYDDANKQAQDEFMLVAEKAGAAEIHEDKNNAFEAANLSASMVSKNVPRSGETINEASDAVADSQRAGMKSANMVDASNTTNINSAKTINTNKPPTKNQDSSLNDYYKSKYNLGTF